MKNAEVGRRRALLRGALGVLAAGTLCACASTPVPHAKVAESRAAVRAAEEVGARSVPRAELHLKLARDQYDQARQMIENGNNQDAALALERAKSDAELAIALTRAAEAQQRARQAQAQIRELEQESTQ